MIQLCFLTQKSFTQEKIHVRGESTLQQCLQSWSQINLISNFQWKVMNEWMNEGWIWWIKVGPTLWVEFTYFLYSNCKVKYYVCVQSKQSKKFFFSVVYLCLNWQKKGSQASLIATPLRWWFILLYKWRYMT